MWRLPTSAVIKESCSPESRGCYGSIAATCGAAHKCKYSWRLSLHFCAPCIREMLRWLQHFPDETQTDRVIIGFHGGSLTCLLLCCRLCHRWRFCVYMRDISGCTLVVVCKPSYNLKCQRCVRSLWTFRQWETFKNVGLMSSSPLSRFVLLMTIIKQSTHPASAWLTD